MRLLKSFKFAAHGIWHCIKYESNFRIHTVAAASVAGFAAVYGVTTVQAAVLTLIIALVFVAELLNTAVEAMVDIISPERSRLAAVAKDCAAGAVLALALGAVVIAAFIFSDLDKLRRCLEFAVRNAVYIAVWIALCAYYIFGVPRAAEKTDKIEQPKKTD